MHQYSAGPCAAGMRCGSACGGLLCITQGPPAWMQAQEEADSGAASFCKFVQVRPSKSVCLQLGLACRCRESIWPAAALDLAVLQDLMPLSSAVPFRPASEETINDPTNPKHYWRFRMHVPLEDLVADTDIVDGLQSMLAGMPGHESAPGAAAL